MVAVVEREVMSLTPFTHPNFFRRPLHPSRSSLCDRGEETSERERRGKKRCRERERWAAERIQ